MRWGVAEEKNSQDNLSPSPGPGRPSPVGRSSSQESEPARDFFGRPRGDSETSTATARNGVRNGIESRDEADAHAISAQIVPQARDPWMRAAVAATLLAMIALGAYARSQLLSTRRSVAQLQFAVGRSRQAAEQETHALIQAGRADVSLGGPGGTLADLSTDTRTGATAVMLHFFNSGRTSARHFGVVAGATRGPEFPKCGTASASETGTPAR